MGNDDEVAVPPIRPIARSRGAERMRASRERRRLGLRCVTVELFQTEIDLLIRWGLLKADARHDTRSVRDSLHAFLDRALG